MGCRAAESPEHPPSCELGHPTSPFAYANAALQVPTPDRQAGNQERWFSASWWIPKDAAPGTAVEAPATEHSCPQMHCSRHVTFSSPVKEQSSVLSDISNRWGCLMCLKQAKMITSFHKIAVIKWQTSCLFAGRHRLHARGIASCLWSRCQAKHTPCEHKTEL